MTLPQTENAPRPPTAAPWRLLGPTAAARAGWTRQNTLLAVLLLVMVVLAVLSALVLIVTGVGQVASVPVALGVAGLFLVAYRLNQVGRYAAAAWLTVIIAAVAIWGLLVFDPPDLELETLALAYLTLPIMLAGLLLPLPATLFTFAGGLVVLLVLQGGTSIVTVANTLIYLGISAALTLATAGLRERHLREIEQRSRELAHSMAQFQNAFEFTSVGMALVALDGRWLQVNDALCDIVGYSEAELQAIDFQRMTHPDDLVGDLAMSQRMLAGEFKSYQLEKRYFHKDGHLLWVALNVSLLRAPDGTPLHFITQIQDISERKQVEDALRASEARFRTLSNSSPVGIYQTDAQGKDVYQNARWLAMTGMDPDEALGDGWLKAVHPDDRAVLAAEWERTVRLHAPFDSEFRFVDRDGQVHWAHSRATPLQSSDGAVTGYVGTVTDITATKQSEVDLQAANTRMAGWVSELETHARDISLLNELSNLLQSCLTASEAYSILQQLGLQLFPGQAGLLGVTNASRNLVETVVAWNDNAAHVPDTLAFSPEDCWALRRGRPHWYEAGPGAVRCPHLGQSSPPSYLCVPMMAHGETLGVLHLQAATAQSPPLTAARRSFAQTVADSVSLALANLKLRERLRDQSIRDVLTGLFNRRYLEETLDRELRRAEREQVPVGVLMLDIDHFKRFNDSFGHGAGDEVLRVLGRLLGRQVRVEDIACRYGGEEFLLVLPGCSLEAARERAETLRQEVCEMHLVHAGQPLGGITVSAGVAAFPEHGADEMAVLRAADGALYRAKQAGRNQVSVANPVLSPTPGPTPGRSPSTPS